MKTLGINSIVQLGKTQATVTSITPTSVTITPTDKKKKTLTLGFKDVEDSLTDGSIKVVQL